MSEHPRARAGLARGGAEKPANQGPSSRSAPAGGTALVLLPSTRTRGEISTLSQNPLKALQLPSPSALPRARADGEPREDDTYSFLWAKT